MALDARAEAHLHAELSVDDAINAYTPGAAYFVIKRGVDVVVSFALLVALLPIFLLAAVVILVDSGWPVFYRSQRVGLHGRQIIVLKFRSMRAEAEPALHREYVHSLLAQETAGGGTVYKVPHDPRVTRAGRLLRTTSVDELPQLWNVLCGEMSLVGPRPDVTYSVEAYEPWMRQRLEATPGMTGLWQVGGRSRLGLRDMLRLDVRYVKERSLALDAKILLMTVPTVLATSDCA